MRLTTRSAKPKGEEAEPRGERSGRVRTYASHASRSTNARSSCRPCRGGRPAVRGGDAEPARSDRLRGRVDHPLGARGPTPPPAPRRVRGGAHGDQLGGALPGGRACPARLRRRPRDRRLAPRPASLASGDDPPDRPDPAAGQAGLRRPLCPPAAGGPRRRRRHPGDLAGADGPRPRARPYPARPRAPAAARRRTRAARPAPLRGARHARRRPSGPRHVQGGAADLQPGDGYRALRPRAPVPPPRPRRRPPAPAGQRRRRGLRARLLLGGGGLRGRTRRLRDARLAGVLRGGPPNARTTSCWPGSSWSASPTSASSASRGRRSPGSPPTSNVAAARAARAGRSHRVGRWPSETRASGSSRRRAT